ncbi:MAG TPA: GTPase HflX [Candidatus Limnocylindrales bacterium]|nr:GTPase HflX [Candidatus Limnocylindrales bacterium]
MDLALLRLDLMGAISVQPDGLPGFAYLAHLLPKNLENKNWLLLDPVHPSQLELDFEQLIRSLEEEFARVQGVRELGDNRERAILVSVTSGSKFEAEDSLAELKELARSSGILVLDSVLQHRPKPDPKFLMGKGKLQELVLKALQLGADLLVFDQELTPAQVRTLADFTDLKIIDRAQLILDIFAQRAHSRVGKVQVELAQLKYMLPRLSTRDDALSRLTGGIGGRGPGETKLEVDRRRVKDRIHRLENELKHLAKGREQRRSRRLKKELPIVSIVGYTNAGKSTLLNALTHSQVYVEDQLFATLDPTSRRLRFPRDLEVIITDTVGFIRDLPKDLMEAFRSTLDELEDADLLLHVVDVSNPRFEEQIQAVNKILYELGLHTKPTLIVFNKEDKVDPKLVENLCRLYQAVSISALQPNTLFKLTQRMEKELIRILAQNPLSLEKEEGEKVLAYN